MKTRRVRRHYRKTSLCILHSALALSHLDLLPSIYACSLVVSCVSCNGCLKLSLQHLNVAPSRRR